MTDEKTKARIRLLANVGKALTQITSERNEDTSYYVALESLNKFRQLIAELDLDYESIEGIQKLTEYLEKKVKKRMQQGLI